MLSQSFSASNPSGCTTFSRDSIFTNDTQDDIGDMSYHLDIVQNPTRARATGWGSKGIV